MPVAGRYSLIREDGREKFVKKHDQLFIEGLGMSKYAYLAQFPDATGQAGQFVMSDEPSHGLNGTILKMEGSWFWKWDHDPIINGERILQMPRLQDLMTSRN